MKLLRQGEPERVILDTLRNAARPLGTHEIATAIMEAGGHGEAARRIVTPSNLA